MCLYFGILISCCSFLVCDDTCREVIMDPTNELLVCTISGHCFDRLLSPSEMELDPVSESFLQHTFVSLVIKQLLFPRPQLLLTHRTVEPYKTDENVVHHCLKNILVCLCGPTMSFFYRS